MVEWLIRAAVMLQMVAVVVTLSGEHSAASAVVSLVACVSSSATLLWLKSKVKEKPANQPAAIYSVPPAVESLASSIAGNLTMGAKSAKTYLDNMPIGLISTDSDGTVRSANLTALRIVKCTSDRFIGTSIERLFILAQRQGRADLESLKESALNRITEASLVPLAEGVAPTPVDLSLAEFTGPAGAGLLFNILDITDRQEVEKLREDFLAILSHDLKTPLTSLSLFLSELEQHAVNEPLSEDQRSSVRTLTGETKRLIRLVSRFLDVARIRAGKLVLNKQKVSLIPMLNQAKLSCSRAAAAGDISISIWSIDDYIIADEDSILQVLDNLINNAIKFSPHGSLIELQASQVSSGIKIAVKDSGVGVPAEKQALIFRRFEQARPEDRSSGSGLGLSICKLIVEQHGGTIGVESAPGGGSLFWFVIPD